MKRSQNSRFFYLKLDFIGEKYIKEYQDKSSQQFKLLSGKIKDEVNN